MLLVKSTPDNTSASSITVQSVNWRIPDQKGFWVLSGPKVRYIQEGEADDEYCICDDHTDVSEYPETTLGDYLGALGHHTNAGNGENSGLSIIVNPHGRDVLEHYFKGICPHCNSKGYSYQRISGFFRRYPELFCSCFQAEVLQICPFCMGYRFAFQDKLDARDIAYLEGMVERHQRAMHKSPISRYLPCEVYDESFEELMSSYEERSKDIYSRKREIGLSLEKHERDSLARIFGGEGGLGIDMSGSLSLVYMCKGLD